MQCVGYSIHRYYDDEDVTRCHTLNPELIEFIEEQGWQILDKLAEGSVSDVFNCRQNKIEAVIIFFSNIGPADNFNIYDKLEAARRFPNIFPIIYDIINTDIPYSIDHIYLNSTGDFVSRSIQVIEKMDMTLESYLQTLTEDEIDEFIPIIESTLIRYLSVLLENNIHSTDLKLDNIAVIINKDSVYIKLIDIEGIDIGLGSHIINYDINKMVRDLILYDVLSGSD